MAEFSAPTQQSSKGTRKRKILSTRVDLTPMVDLGFLLITFFIFTTSMSEPKAMKLKLPQDAKPGDSLQTAENKTLNLVLGKGNQLWYYNGNSIQDMKQSNYSTGIREVLQEKKKWVSLNFGKDEMVVLVKPTTDASFSNIVDVLDEMLINQVSRYVLMEPNDEEISRALHQLKN
jgi:biopolymer transport protein ExbD